MQIKVERFLTLTAMLASAQVGLVGCGDDGGNTEPSTTDAGNTEADTATSDSDSGHSVDAGNHEDTGNLNATLDNEDAGASPDGSVPADAGSVDAAVWTDGGTAPGSSSGDAGGQWSDAGETVWTDAGSETTWSDAGSEWTADGGVACLDGDFADEGQATSCYATFGACPSYTLAASTCDMLVADYRAGIVETFWDCYEDAAIADPCSEEADSAASSCYSFSVEYAPLCDAAVEDCTTVVDNCGEVTLAECQGVLEQYNSTSRARTLSCVAEALSNQPGPSYEGCGYDFYYCINWSPSVE